MAVITVAAAVIQSPPQTMTNFHLSIKVIKRSKRKNSLKYASYRHAQLFKEGKTGEVFRNHTHQDVIHSEMSIPENAPQWAQDLKAMHPYKASEKLWNAVEMIEKRKNAQVCREYEFAIPHELNEQQRIDFVRDFIQENITSKGMIADWAIHNYYCKKDQIEKPHVHIGVTMRNAVDPLTVRNKKFYSYGDIHFGNKERSWNQQSLAKELRVVLEICQNKHLVMAKIERRVDHRSYAEQGIAFLPQPTLGKSLQELILRGERVERVKEYERVSQYNRHLIHQDPNIVLDYITRGQAVFERKDIAKVLNRYITDSEEFSYVMSQIERSDNLVRILGNTHSYPERFTTKEMVNLGFNMMEKEKS